MGRNVMARLPLPLLQRSTGEGPCLALYHAVTDCVPQHLTNLVACRNVATFRRDLDFLLKRFQPVSMDQIIAWATQDKPLPPGHLTFLKTAPMVAAVSSPLLS